MARTAEANDLPDTYEHFWYQNVELPDFTSFSADIRRLVDEVARGDIRLASWDGTGEPLITPDAISFNGAAPDHAETFTVLRVVPEDSDSVPHLAAPGHAAGGPPVSFPALLRSDCVATCLTLQKPYDLAVIAAIVLAHERWGTCFVAETFGVPPERVGRRSARR